MAAVIRDIDWESAGDVVAFKSLLQHYASGPTGGGKALPEDAVERTVLSLKSWPTASVLLAVDRDSKETFAPLGYSVFFRGWSTFAGKARAGQTKIARVAVYSLSY